MDNFLNTSVIWFIVGFAFFLLEFVVPGFILFFFGIGAWLVAFLTLFTDVTVNVQLMVFIGASILTALLFRNWVRAKLGTYGEGPRKLEDEFIGKVGRAETPIGPGINGKVDFKGTTWAAASDDMIAAGEAVQIIETRSILLIVKSHK